MEYLKYVARIGVVAFCVVGIQNIYWYFSKDVNLHYAVDTENPDAFDAINAHPYQLTTYDEQLRVYDALQENAMISTGDHLNNSSFAYSNWNATIPRMTSDGIPIKKILFWNRFFHREGFGVDLGLDSLSKIGCPVHQCYFTNDTSELDEADAIVIHGFAFSRMRLPPRRKKNQIYVFFLFENPLLTGALTRLYKLHGVFNLTFTYMDDPDTDIAEPHGGAQLREIPRKSAVPKFDFVNTRTKVLLWIVSNCHSISARHEYARKLSEYIHIDMVGRCGNLTCPESTSITKASTQCIRSLAPQYMFYLSFENSHCQGYYTEKVINPLRFQMVPITMGGANYSKHLPPNSYIDANDYSPKDLARKLIHLQNHKDEYMQYFQWKNQYHIIHSFRRQGFCKLCEILHTPNYPYKTNFSVEQYWNPDKRCLTKAQHLSKLGIA